MKWTLLVLALVIGSAGTSRAQVFRPRGKGPIVHKAEPAKAAVDPKKPEVAAKAEPKKAEPAVASRKVAPKSRVASDSRPDDLTPDTAPKKAKKKVQAKRKKGGDDDVQVTDDADDDVKVTDD
jgi:hypothetical protein